MTAVIKMENIQLAESIPVAEVPRGGDPVLEGPTLGRLTENEVRGGLEPQQPP